MEADKARVKGRGRDKDMDKAADRKDNNRRCTCPPRAYTIRYMCHKPGRWERTVWKLCSKARRQSG